jgi:hypothetical protein
VTVVLDVGADTKGELTNIATVRSDQFDANPEDNDVAVVSMAQLPPATLTGRVYVDMNDNGVFDQGEIGIGGARVMLDGVDEDGKEVHLNQIVAEDGVWVFSNLAPGDYYVTEVQPDMFTSGQTTEGQMIPGGTGTPSGEQSGTDQFFFQVGSGDSGIEYNFGELFPFLTRRMCLASSK